MPASNVRSGSRGELHDVWVPMRDAGVVRRYRAGEPLFHASDRAVALHAIVAGQVKLALLTPEGQERIVAIAGPGDLVGAAAALRRGPYGVDAMALTDVVTSGVGREAFLREVATDPETTLALADSLARQLQRAWDALAGGFAPVKRRLAEALLDQAERFGTVAASGHWLLRTPLSHDDLAAMIGANRVSVSTAMAELRAEGVVDGSRGSYRLHPSELRRAAGEADGAALA